MLVTLKGSGALNAYTPTVPEPGETPASLDREAMLVYVGKFESMDGPVEVKPEHLTKLNDNHNDLLSKFSNLAAGDVPMKNYPPIQLDHSVLAKDTVGRLVGPTKIGTHTPKDGIEVPALFGTVRVLGKENVEKVQDGRWTHLSVGVDFEEGKWQELTITPFPAAADASMLSRMAKKSKTYKGRTISIEPGPGVSWYVLVDDIRRGPFQKEDDAWLAAEQIVESGVLKQFSRGNTMFERLKAYLMRTKKLSEADAEDHAKKMSEEEKKTVEMAEGEREKLKKYLTGHKKMSEDDAEKHLAEADHEKMRKLAAEVDEHEKKMAAEPGHEAGKAEMAAARVSLTKLSTDFRSSAAEVQLGLKKTKILSRLSRLQSNAKITPAEFKKIEIAKLSAENDATIDAVLKSYEDREPVIFTGMMGSKKGVDVSGAYKQTRMTQLERETRENMPFLARASGTKLAGDKKSTPGTPSNTDSSGLDENESTPHEAVEKLAEIHKEGEKHMNKAMAAIDAGNHGEAKDHMRKLMEHYKASMSARHMASSEEPSGKADAEMSALAENFQKLQNGFNDIMALTGKIVGA